MSALIINRQIVHYEVLGHGRPLILLHGWVGSWRDWLATMQATSSSYRCYAIDLWGFGDTDRSAEHYDLAGQADLILEFLDGLGIGKIALVGHGLGAVVAAAFTAQFPELVDRLMLVGYPHRQDDIHTRLQVDSSEDLIQWLHNGIPGQDSLSQEAAKMDVKALRKALDGMQTEQLEAYLRHPSLPRLFLYGGEDPVVSRPGASTLSEDYQTHYFLLERAGHLPMISMPDKFNRLLKDFLALQPEESPKSLQLKDEWKRRFR